MHLRRWAESVARKASDRGWRGNILALLNEANFGNETSLDFCSRFQCMLTLSALVNNRECSGVGDGQIFLSPNNSIPPFEYNSMVEETFPIFFRIQRYHRRQLSGLLGRQPLSFDTILVLGSCNLMASAEMNQYFRNRTG